METRGGKIIDFLRENNHLDLEVPDIAFNVKKSEKTVEAALKKFQQKGLVTARQNEYGRVYWYALPSAPITKTFKAEEISAPKEESMNDSNNINDEVDLSELTGKKAVNANKNGNTIPSDKSNDTTSGKKAPVKKRTTKTTKPKAVKSAAKTTKTTKAKSAVKVSSAKDSTPASVPKTSKVSSSPAIPQPEKKTENDVFEAVKEPTAKPQPIVEPVVEENAVKEENITDEISFEPSPTSNDFASSNKPMSVSPTLIAVAIVALISLIALMKSNGSVKQIKAVEATIPKDVVSTADFNVVKEQEAKIQELEGKVTTLATDVDSLKSQLKEMAEAAKPPKKKVVKKRRYAPVKKRKK